MSIINRLIEDYGFSIEDIDKLSGKGWSARKILKTIEDLINDGATTIDYARQTFEEMYSELFQEQPEIVCQAKRADEFGESKVSFVWYPYIPIGDYTVLMAPGGTGKTYFVCGIAAAISTGRALPGDFETEPGNVLIISAEDSGELLKQRLMASGADLTRVYIFDRMNSVGMNFSTGHESFKAAIKQYNPKLVIVDPWHGFIGENADVNKINVVRPIFQKLAVMAKDLNCGLILVSHVNKRAQGENANNAATGSTDFVNAARSALYVIFDEEDEDQRIVVHTKTNYARYGRSVCFRIVDGGIVWSGFSDIDRQTMEKAARNRKTPREIQKESSRQDEINQRLVSALLDAADPQKVKRFTYTAFAEKYGLNIFGIMQPKRALDTVADMMYSRGYDIQAGIMVRQNGDVGKGFVISAVN